MSVPRQSVISHRRRPSGFTLVELLVVIAIIGVLIALMLPAIQASRETARRANCTSNLAQLAIAVFNYESAHEVYPPGVDSETGPIQSTPDGSQHAWLVRLLPYVDEKNAFRLVDFSVGVYDPKHSPVRAIRPTLYVCPSAPEDPDQQASYAGGHHDVEVPIDADNHGIFFRNSRVRPDDVSDGLSKTIFVGERLLESGDLGWMSGSRAALRNTGTRPNQTIASAIGVGRGIAPDAQTDDEPAEENAAKPPAEPGADETPQPEQRPQPATPDIRPGSPLYVGGFGSYHPGELVNFVFGDGSVRGISDTIDRNVYRQLGHRADGKLLDINNLGW